MHFQEKNAEVHRKSTDTIRKLLSLTRVKVSDAVLNDLEKDYVKDEYFKEKWSNVKEPYFKKDKRLYFENRLLCSSRKPSK